MGPILEAGRRRHGSSTPPGLACTVPEAAPRSALAWATAVPAGPQPTVGQGFKPSVTPSRLPNHSCQKTAFPGLLEVTTAGRNRLRPEWARGGRGYFGRWVGGGLFRTKQGCERPASKVGDSGVVIFWWGRLSLPSGYDERETVGNVALSPSQTAG